MNTEEVHIYSSNKNSHQSLRLNWSRVILDTVVLSTITVLTLTLALYGEDQTFNSLRAMRIVQVNDGNFNRKYCKYVLVQIVKNDAKLLHNCNKVIMSIKP